jgi:hypothetical protein
MELNEWRRERRKKGEGGDNGRRGRWRGIKCSAVLINTNESGFTP